MTLEPCTMSGEKTASGVILNAQGMLMAVDILAPSTGTAVLKIYDNASAASGTILFEANIFAGVPSQSINMAMARFVTKGLYASWTNTSGDAAFNVGYSRAG